MKILMLKSNNPNYKYYIKYNGYLSPRCKYPKEVVTEKTRLYRVDYINCFEQTTRSLIYPKSLFFTKVLPDDLIENEIIEITNYLPDWTMIEIIEK